MYTRMLYMSYLYIFHIGTRFVLYNIETSVLFPAMKKSIELCTQYYKSFRRINTIIYIYVHLRDRV